MSHQQGAHGENTSPKDPFHVQTCNKFHANISTDLIPSDDSKSNTSVVGIRFAQRVGLVRSRSDDQTNNQAVQAKGFSEDKNKIIPEVPERHAPNAGEASSEGEA